MVTGLESWVIEEVPAVQGGPVWVDAGTASVKAATTTPSTATFVSCL
jgi:hypothetical protein